MTVRWRDPEGSGRRQVYRGTGKEVPADRDLDYDHGSIEPDRTRLSAKTARAAVAEFVATGRRPACVTWQEY
jgi:Immunity protein Imm1